MQAGVILNMSQNMPLSENEAPKLLLFIISGRLVPEKPLANADLEIEPLPDECKSIESFFPAQNIKLVDFALVCYINYNSKIDAFEDFKTARIHLLEYMRKNNIQEIYTCFEDETDKPVNSQKQIHLREILSQNFNFNSRELLKISISKEDSDKISKAYASLQKFKSDETPKKSFLFKDLSKTSAGKYIFYYLIPALIFASGLNNAIRQDVHLKGGHFQGQDAALIGIAFMLLGIALFAHNKIKAYFIRVSLAIAFVTILIYVAKQQS